MIRGEKDMKEKLKGFGKDILFFLGAIVAVFLVSVAIKEASPVYADANTYTVNTYIQINGSMAQSPSSLTGKNEGDYIEIPFNLVLPKDEKQYLLKSYGDATANGLPKYTYRNTDGTKAYLGFLMPARDVNIKVIYEEATTYDNNISNNLRRVNDDEGMTGSMWQVSDIYAPIEGTTFSTLTGDISPAVKEGVGDSIVYSANPFLSGGSTYNKTIYFDFGSEAMRVTPARAGDLVVYPVPYEENGHYLNDESVTLTGKNGELTFINNSASYDGTNTFFLKRYVMDDRHNRYVLLVFTMPDDDVTISASYPTAIPAPTQAPVPTGNGELSKKINSTGLLKIEFEDGREPVLIDTDDIQKNRDDILRLQEQLGGAQKITSYKVGSHIYFVAGDHTNIMAASSEEEALAIINAEKKGEPFVEFNGSTITLVEHGNSTWQQVY